MDAEAATAVVAVWRCTNELVVALDAQLGEPTDCYVNGSQVWLRDDGPRDVTLEWRLHPVGGYQRPPATSTQNVFRRIVRAVVTANGGLQPNSGDGSEPPSAEPNLVGDPVSLWGGLEVFSAYDDTLDADELRAACVALLGIEPDAVGPVDHDLIGNEWERSGGASDIISALMTQLGR